MAAIGSSRVSRLAYEGGGYKWALFRITGLTSADTYDTATSFSSPTGAVLQTLSVTSSLALASTGIAFNITGLNSLGFVMVQGEAPA